MGPRSLSVSAFGAPSLGVFVLVGLKGETIRGIVDNFLAAVRTACFLLPWGFVPITVVVVVAFACSAAAAVAAATLGECCTEFCILCHDIRYLLALFHEFGLEKREGIERSKRIVPEPPRVIPLGSRCRGRV